MVEQLFIFIALSFALAMDAFAVSISLGTAGLANNVNNRVKIGLSFGFFQGFLFLIGYISLSLVNAELTSFNQYIASFLLAFIGIKMIVEVYKKDKDECPHNVCLGLGCQKSKCDRTGQFRYLNMKLLLIFAILTSIDAMAAGISYGLKYNYSINIIYFIGAITLVLSILGAKFGKKLQHIIGNKSDLIGGLILVLLAIKALVS